MDHGWLLLWHASRLLWRFSLYEVSTASLTTSRKWLKSNRLRFFAYFTAHFMRVLLPVYRVFCCANFLQAGKGGIITRQNVTLPQGSQPDTTGGDRMMSGAPLSGIHGAFAADRFPPTGLQKAGYASVRERAPPYVTLRFPDNVRNFPAGQHQKVDFL